MSERDSRSGRPPGAEGTGIHPYAFALLATAMGVALRVLVDPWVGPIAPFSTSYFAILATAWYAGFAPAMATTLFSAAAIVFLVMEPRYSFSLVDASAWWSVAMHFASGTGIAALGGAMAEAHRTAEASRRDAEKAARALSDELGRRLAVEEEFRLANLRLEDRVRERTDELLRSNVAVVASEARLNAIVDSAMEGIVTTDDRMRITLFNPAAETIFGYRAADVLDRPLEVLIPERYRGTHAGLMERFAQAEGRPQRMQAPRVITGLRADGREFPLEASISWSRVGDGRQFTAMVRDVTSRHRAEAELRDSRAQLATALAAGGMGTWSFDPVTRTVHWDETAKRLWGRGHETAAGRRLETVLSWIHPEDRNEVRLRLEAEGGEDEIHGEYRVTLPDGTVRWHASHARVHRDAGGEVTGVTGVTMDVTQSREQEEARSRAQKLEALGILAGGVAHDFNNILMAIGGNAELATWDLPEDHPARTNLLEIDKAAKRARDVVKRILTFSRPDEARRETVCLREVVEEALRLGRAALPARVELVATLPGEPRLVRADPNQLQQVILNLVTNAVQAIDANGRVEVRVEDAVDDTELPTGLSKQPGRRWVLLRVRDDGAGMTQEVAERIFDPFFTTKPQGEGTGLGLSVVHGIVRSHRGAIEVETVPGEGTTFTIWLPLEEHAAVAAAPSAADRPTDASRRGGRVLFVDDEDSLVLLVTRALRQHGFEVEGFSVPELALRRFLQKPDDFDAVVSDLSMPHISGFEFAAAVLAERPAMPVLLMSGYVKAEDEDRAKAIGIREMLLKPDTVEDLATALERAIGARNADGPGATVPAKA